MEGIVRQLFILLPVIILATGWLLGRMRLYRAMIGFGLWILFSMIVGAYLTIIGAADSNPMLFFTGGLVAVLLGLFAPWVAIIVSLTSKRITPAPAQVIASGVVTAYQNLDDTQKSKLHATALKGAPIIARGFAAYLEKKGWAATAGAIRETSQLL